MAFTDNFTDTAGTALESHTPSGGTAWTNYGTAGIFSVNAADSCAIQNAGGSGYDLCDDQGSADHYSQGQIQSFSSSITKAILGVRVTDDSNCAGFYLAGTGGAGRRLCKIVGGTLTDLNTSQGISGEWIKVEASSATATIYKGGTGATPSWVSVGSGSISDLTSTTRQGLVNTGSTTTAAFIDDFEAGTLGGGGTTVSLNSTSFSFAANAPELKTGLSMGAPSFGFTAQAIENKITLNLGSASFSFTPHAVTFLGATILSLGVAAFGFSAEAVTLATILSFGAAALTMSGQAITLTKNRILQLGAAVFTFSGRRLTIIAGGVASIFSTLIVRWRRRGRR